MTDLQKLFEEVDQLTPEEAQQLYGYLKSYLDSVHEVQQPNVRKERILGLHAHLGEAWMSDDFDDELPDSFWLGEE